MVGPNGGSLASSVHRSLPLHIVTRSGTTGGSISQLAANQLHRRFLTQHHRKTSLGRLFASEVPP
jgi:hypothetical protein